MLFRAEKSYVMVGRMCRGRGKTPGMQLSGSTRRRSSPRVTCGEQRAIDDILLTIILYTTALRSGAGHLSDDRDGAS